MWHLCLDMGGTKTVGALFDPSGREVARAQAGPGAVSLGVDVSEAAVRAVWAEIGDRSESRVRICAGLAGIGLRERVATLTKRLDDFAQVSIVGDGYGMLLAATGGMPGAMIALGTGVAAMRLMPDGHFRTLSGWGFPAGDRGSGAWIGLQAVSVLVQRIDGVEIGASMGGNLAKLLIDALGGNAEAIMDRNTGGKAKDFAALAPLIFDAANSGDVAARSIIAEAATEIAAIGRALWDGGPGAVLLGGGLAPVLAPWVREVSDERDWTVAWSDPLAGLSLMARGLAPEERLLPRPGLTAPDY